MPGHTSAGQHILSAARKNTCRARASAGVRHEHQPVATFCESIGQRFSREEMSAGAACGNDDRALGHTGRPCLRVVMKPPLPGTRSPGWCRVRASTMPMASATDMAEDPP